MPESLEFSYNGKTVVTPVIDDQFATAPAPSAEQQDILFDPATYTAFPYLVRLDGDELLLSFRQAPREAHIQHTHPRSVGTVMRSYDLGQHWDVENATQVGAGGGGGIVMLYLGDGLVAGALPRHSVAPRHEAARAGLRVHPHEYPFGLDGTYWVWSNNWGLLWPLVNCSLVSHYGMACAEPYRLPNGEILLPTYGAGGPVRTCSSLLYRSASERWDPEGAVVMALGTPDTREYYEPAVVELEPGHLFALHRVGQTRVGADNTFWANESFDGGVTWSEPVDTGIISGACPRLLKLSDGRLLLTFGRRQPPFGLRAMLSVDGKSWGDRAYILREAPNWDQGYTASVELGDGRILTVSYMQNAAGVTGIVGTFWTLP